MKFLIFICGFRCPKREIYLLAFFQQRPDITDLCPQKCVSTKTSVPVQRAIVALIIVAVMASISADSPDNQRCEILDCGG